ncbi:MAG TPA: hypothetical protein VGF87_07545 [Acidimicrobiales bacterium]
MHDPEAGAGVMVMLRAAIVVLDFFEGVPVTVTQSPAVIALTVSLTVLENVVVPLQLTVVWPVDWFWTSMEDPVMAATEPLALPNELVAAPAVMPVINVTAALSASTAPVADNDRRPDRGPVRVRGIAPVIAVSLLLFR